MTTCRYDGKFAAVLEENELGADGQPSGKPRLLVWDRDGFATVHSHADPAKITSDAAPAPAPAPVVNG